MSYQSKDRSPVTLLVVVLVVILLGVLGLRQAIAVLDMPYVHVSYETGKCVSVDDPAWRHEGRSAPYTCDRLPEKYRTVVVP